MLEPAVLHFAAGQTLVDRSAVIKGEKMPQHFTVSFCRVVLFFHFTSACLEDNGTCPQNHTTYIFICELR